MRISDWSSDVCSSDLAKGVEPSGQSETRHRVVAKVREAAVRPDEREVPDAPASRKIGVHVRGGLKSELFDHGRQDRRGDLGRRDWKCDKKPGARQHHGEAEPQIGRAKDCTPRTNAQTGYH